MCPCRSYRHACARALRTGSCNLALDGSIRRCESSSLTFRGVVRRPGRCEMALGWHLTGGGDQPGA